MVPSSHICYLQEHMSKLNSCNYVEDQLKTAERVVVVWDKYIQSSIKHCARQKRGIAKRRRVLPNTAVPSDWQDFLRLEENKQELFAFLAGRIESIPVPHGKLIIATHGNEVLCNPSDKIITNISPCTPEEADTRIMI